MREKLPEEEILYADETMPDVLREPGKITPGNSNMQLYRTGKEAGSFFISQ